MERGRGGGQKLLVIYGRPLNVNMKNKTEIFQIQIANDLTGYSMGVGALVLSAFGSVLTKKITQQFDKTVIAACLGIAIGTVGWMQVRNYYAVTSLNKVKSIIDMR